MKTGKGYSQGGSLMPFNMNWPEILLILVIVLIIFGAGKLPQIGNALGKSIKEFRKARTEDEEENKGKTTAKSSETETKEKS
jgi:sec-independent protein translocase protein TatA